MNSRDGLEDSCAPGACIILGTMMGLFVVIYIGLDAVSAPRVHRSLETK